MTRPAQACRPTRFPPGVADRVDFYVYILLDPRTCPPTPFYVGKGRGNRVFAHARDALASPHESHKLRLIRAIRRAGHEVAAQIVRHQLDERTALAVEAAAIDLVRHHLNPDVSNEVRGHDREHGLVDLDELVERYAARPLEFREPVVLIRIARRWKRGMAPEALYEATRRAWRISATRARGAHFVVAVADGVVRAVYADVEWRLHPATKGPNRGRRGFTARPAHERAGWIGRSVAAYLPNGSQNPITYVRGDRSCGLPRPESLALGPRRWAAGSSGERAGRRGNRGSNCDRPEPFSLEGEAPRPPGLG